MEPIQHIEDHIRVIRDVEDKLLPNIEDFAAKIVECYLNKNCLYLMGNGGSAADAQHFAAEFVVRFHLNRDPLPAMALHTNSSTITAHANDYEFETVFERQIHAWVKPGDVVIGISTSGTSPNVVRGIKEAKKRGAVTIAMTGETGGNLAEISDLLINVPSNSTARIQEAHILIIHMVCELVERRLFI